MQDVNSVFRDIVTAAGRFHTDFTSKIEGSIGDMGFLPEGHAMRDSVSPIQYRCIMEDSRLALRSENLFND